MVWGMAEFFLFQHRDPERFFAVAQRAAEEFGYMLLLDQLGEDPWRNFGSHFAPETGVMALDTRALSEGARWSVWKKVGEVLGCPWLAFYLQEKMFWEMQALRGAETVDLFSPWPEFWEEGPVFEKGRRGNPAAVAELWGLEGGTIERYMVDWEAMGQSPDVFGPKQVAYPADRHTYGELWQVLDVMRVFGAPDILGEGRREHGVRKVEM
jgi:hypothetical protein